MNSQRKRKIECDWVWETSKHADLHHPNVIKINERTGRFSTTNYKPKIIIYRSSLSLTVTRRSLIPVHDTLTTSAYSEQHRIKLNNLPNPKGNPALTFSYRSSRQLLLLLLLYFNFIFFNNLSISLSFSIIIKTDSCVTRWQTTFHSGIFGQFVSSFSKQRTQ